MRSPWTSERSVEGRTGVVFFRWFLSASSATYWSGVVSLGITPSLSPQTHTARLCHSALLGEGQCLASCPGVSLVPQNGEDLSLYASNKFCIGPELLPVVIGNRAASARALH